MRKTSRCDVVMNKKEALKACLEGKKIRRTHWDLSYYIYWDEEDFEFKDKNGCLVDITNLSSVVWEIVEEPKPEKTVPKLYVSFYTNSMGDKNLKLLNKDSLDPDDDNSEVFEIPLGKKVSVEKVIKEFEDE